MTTTSRVELQRYPESASACLVKSMLESEGITSTVHRVSRYAGMGGSGYVLKVGPDDVARARALIDATPGEVDMDEYVDADDTSYRRCPRCQSVMVSREAMTGPQRFLMLSTLGVAWFFLVKSYTCRKCGAVWQGR